MSREWIEKGGKEDRDCNRKTAFKIEIWREWEEQQQKIAGVGEH